VLVIGKSKTGIEIQVPLSWPIIRALRLARAAPGEWIFPARGRSGHIEKFAGDGLEVYGTGLRHLYRLVATECGVSEISIRILLGHSLRGISEGYLPRALFTGGPSLRAAQATISRRVIELLGSEFNFDFFR
jgi:integrase